MNEFEITNENLTSFKLSINRMMNGNYSVDKHTYTQDTSTNRGNITIFLKKDEDSPEFLSYSLILPFNGLPISAAFDVYLIETKDNGEEIRTHQEVALNIEKPIKESSTFS